MIIISVQCNLIAILLQLMKINDYEPPPVPDEMFSNSESELSDTPHYILNSSEEEEEEEEE